MNPRGFDELSATLNCPMYVVTAWDGVERSGCLIGFATECAMQPPRWLACISKTNHTYRVALRATSLALHILRADQFEIAKLFGGTTSDDGVDKFARCAWHPGPDGVPMIDDCDYVAGRIIDRFDLGDHGGHLIEITAAGIAHAPPQPQLGFQAVRTIVPGHAP